MRNLLSYLGTPITRNVNFLQPENNSGIDYTFTNRNVTLNDVLVTITQPKNIIKTQLVRPQGYSDNPSQQFSAERNWGYTGTVKEYISAGDFQIRLQGLLVSEDNKFPQEKLDALLEYLDYPGAIGISGEFINSFDNVTQVVVERYNFAEQRGYTNQLPFTINLLSDDYITVKYENTSG